MPKDVQQREGTTLAMPEDFGVWVWVSAECSEGSDSSCVDFDNKSSRSCTLVNLQDV